MSHASRFALVQAPFAVAKAARFVAVATPLVATKVIRFAVLIGGANSRGVVRIMC